MASCGLLIIALGCSGGAPGLEVQEPGFRSARTPLEEENGLVTNGLVTNGLVTNGLVTNGMSTNGLSTNTPGTNGLALRGLSASSLESTDFRSWFNANPASYSDMVMKYVVRCAVAAGDSRTWINPTTGVTYTWSGVLGLTPGWASGQAATEVEQQLLTACLAAHVNKYGLHVTLSVVGEDAAGTPIPLASDELSTFAQHEACFFGNLFTGEGIYSANDRGSLNPAESSIRACGLSSQASGTSSECAPIVHVGSCSDANCVLDPTGTYYVQCSYNGRTYRPLTTRIRPQDLYTCGDGVCQFTESCGTGATYGNCGLDCGPCP